MVTNVRPSEIDTTRSPVAACTIGAIVCAFLAIGIMGAYLPRSVPMEWPLGFLASSVVFTLAAVWFLTRRPNFNWRLFFAVARWVLIVTTIFSGMAVFIFIYDHTPGRTLAVMAAVLALTAVNLPVLLGFSVARHQPLDR